MFRQIREPCNMQLPPWLQQLATSCKALLGLTWKAYHVIRHSSPVTVRPSPVTLRLAPSPLHPSSIRHVWPIKVRVRSWVWRSIYVTSDIIMDVTVLLIRSFGYLWQPGPIKPLNSKIMQPSDPKIYFIFLTSFRNTSPNLWANGSAVAKKNADRQIHDMHSNCRTFECTLERQCWQFGPYL